MDSGRWRRGVVYHGMLQLLALHAVNEYYRLPWKPPITAGLLATSTLIYLRPSFLDSLLPFIDELKEFHKKKAAEKAKKATSTSQTNVSDSLNEKQQLEYLVVSLNEKLCSIYLSKLIVANENILEKEHDFYSTK